MLENMEKHLSQNLVKVYDPFIKNDVVANQYHDLEKFLNDIDLIVVMVKHSEIRENVEKLKDKIVLDCHNIIDLPKSYKL